MHVWAWRKHRHANSVNTIADSNHGSFSIYIIIAHQAFELQIFYIYIKSSRHSWDHNTTTQSTHALGHRYVVFLERARIAKRPKYYWDENVALSVCDREHRTQWALCRELRMIMKPRNIKTHAENFLPHDEFKFPERQQVPDAAMPRTKSRDSKILKLRYAS